MDKDRFKQAIRDRRLRVLYDLLDQRNYKKLLAKSDEQLRKWPDLEGAMVYKALAMVRLGHKGKAIELMEELAARKPTDQQVLSMMSICYRELDMPEEVSKVYTVAVNILSNQPDGRFLWEDFFQALTKVNNYNEQYTIATKMYKLYKKAQYLIWAIVSLLVKSATQWADPPSKTVTLKLAARMMEKYMEEVDRNNEKFDAAESLLHVEIMLRLSDHEKALDLINKYLPEIRSPWIVQKMKQMQRNCLKSLGKPELREMLEEELRNVDHEDFTNYRIYIDNYATECPDRVLKMLQELEKSESKNVRKNAQLALLIFTYIVNTKKIDVSVSPPLDQPAMFVEYFKNYATRPFFCRDMRNVIKYFQRNDPDVFNSVQEKLAENSGSTATIEAVIQYKTNYYCTKYYLYELNIQSKPASVIHWTNKLLGVFLEANRLYESGVARRDPREYIPYGDLLSTACGALLKTFWNKTGFWIDYGVDEDMRRLNVTKENGVEDQNLALLRQKWMRAEIPVILALALMEYAVAVGPSCFGFRLILSKLYFYCGATKSAVDEFEELDIKHIQIDTMGYLCFNKLLNSGLVSECRKALAFANASYDNLIKDVQDNYFSGYKIHAWQIILDFMGLRQSVYRSVQHMSARPEMRILEYVVEGNSSEEILQIADRQGFDAEGINNSFEDNREFRVHYAMMEDYVNEDYINMTFEDSVSRLRLRAALQISFTYIIKAANEVHNRRACSGYLQLASFPISTFRNLSTMSYDQCMDKKEERTMFGPWPPTMFDYVNSGVVCSLRELLEIVWTCGLALDTANGNGVPEELPKICYSLSTFSHAVKERFDVFIKHWAHFDASLHAISSCNEELYIFVEGFSLLCVLTDCLRAFFERMVPIHTVEGKGKRRDKQDTVTAGSVWATTFNQWVQCLGQCLRCLEARLEQLEYAAAHGWYSTSWTDEEQSYWEPLLLPNAEELFKVVKDKLPLVCSRLRGSQVQNYLEMRLIVTAKKKFVDTLLVKKFDRGDTVADGGPQ